MFALLAVPGLPQFCRQFTESKPNLLRATSERWRGQDRVGDHLPTNGIQEVVGSIPISSTNRNPSHAGRLSGVPFSFPPVPAVRSGTSARNRVEAPDPTVVENSRILRDEPAAVGNRLRDEDAVERVVVMPRQ